MKKVIGYILFFIRLTQKGDKVIWSNEKSVVSQGSLGAGRMWSAPKPNAPAPRYWAPETSYSPDDLQTLIDSGYGTLYIKEDGSEYLTVDEMNARIQPPVTTQPTVQPPVMSPQ